MFPIIGFELWKKEQRGDSIDSVCYSFIENIYQIKACLFALGYLIAFFLILLHTFFLFACITRKQGIIFFCV